MEITYKEWLSEFNKISQKWVSENKDRIMRLTDIEIGEIGDELQADAYSSVGGERLDLTEWESYDSSCADRNDFEYKLKQKMAKG